MAPLLGVALLAAAARSVSATPNRSATLWGCTTPDGVQVHVDWGGYHPDTMQVLAWVDGGAVTTFSTPKTGVDWKFGTAYWDTSTTGWLGSSPSLLVGSGTNFAVDLYGKGKFI